MLTQGFRPGLTYAAAPRLGCGGVTVALYRSERCAHYCEVASRKLALFVRWPGIGSAKLISMGSAGEPALFCFQETT